MSLFKTDKKEPLSSQKLTDITRGMHHAAATTSTMLTRQYLDMFQQYFDVDEQGQYQPKTVAIAVTDDRVIKVPLISLVYPKGLALENMKVAFSVSLLDSAQKVATHSMDGSNATRSSFKVELAPKNQNNDKRGKASNTIDIEMEFAAFDPPEGIMRAIDQFTSLVGPYEIPPTKPDTPHDAAGYGRTAISAARSNRVVMEQLSRFGFDHAKLDEGLALANQVRFIEQEHQKAEIKIVKLERDAKANFDVTTKVAQIAFRDNRQAAQELGLERQGQTASPKWSAVTATAFYEALLASEVYLAAMATYGTTFEQLTAEADALSRLTELIEEKNELTSSPELAQFSGWMSDFRSILELALEDHQELLGQILPNTKPLKMQ